MRNENVNWLEIFIIGSENASGSLYIIHLRTLTALFLNSLNIGELSDTGFIQLLWPDFKINLNRFK